LAATFARLPLSFELNQGQADRGIRFLARGADSTLYLTAADAVLTLAPSERGSQAGAVLRFHPAGASTHPQVVGQDLLPGTANYFVGADRRSWHTALPTYARVAYRGIYRGVDLVYYGTQGNLEYDFVLAPGADPHLIRLDITGADSLSIDARGDLILHTAAGEIRQHKPVIYQQMGSHRRSLDGHFVLLDGHEVGFAVTRYDAHRPLVIDPVLSYSSLYGYYDVSTGITLDRAGNIYITGYVITGPPPPTPPGAVPTTRAYQITPLGAISAFVAKIDPRGTRLLFSTYLGGSTNRVPASASNYGTHIAVDSTGSAYVVGYTDATNFPVTTNALQHRLIGGTDVFITKLNSNGRSLLYSTYLGGSTDNADSQGSNVGIGIAVDRAGNAYVTGYTYAYNFPLKNALQGSLGYGKGTLGSQVDAFVTKLNPAGSALIYSTYLGGSLTDMAAGIAVDAAGDAYIVGQTNSPDFPIAPHALQATLYATDYNTFVVKLNPSGNRLVYGTYLGHTAGDKPHAIALDTSDNVYIAGETTGGIPRTLGVAQPTSGGGIDAFVTKLNGRGVLVYSTYLGGVGDDIGYGVAVDGLGNAYVTGSTGSATFNTPVFPLKRALQGTLGGNRGGFGMTDAFIAKLDSCGSGLLYSSYLGGTFADAGTAIAVDGRENAYVAGTTLSPNFPLHYPMHAGKTYVPPNTNVFIAKIGATREPGASACPLPLTIDLSAPQVAVSSTLTITVHTAPGAQVQTTLEVTNTVPPPATSAKTAGPKPPKLGAVLYRVQINGSADAYGLYVGAIRVRYVTTTPIQAMVTVRTRNPQAHATGSTSVLIVPQ
jgi:hypothetical protein